MEEDLKKALLHSTYPLHCHPVWAESHGWTLVQERRNFLIASSLFLFRPPSIFLSLHPPFLLAEKTGTGNTHSLTTWCSLAGMKHSSQYVPFHFWGQLWVCVCVCEEARGEGG